MPFFLESKTFSNYTFWSKGKSRRVSLTNNSIEEGNKTTISQRTKRNYLFLPITFTKKPIYLIKDKERFPLKSKIKVRKQIFTTALDASKRFASNLQDAKFLTIQVKNCQINLGTHRS